MRKLLIILLACSTPILLLANGEPASGKPEFHKWRISFGGISRSIDNIIFHTGTRSSASLIPSQAHSGVDSPGSAGSPNGTGDHYYDNGYVRQDPGTATDGDTWYWGYSDASQVQGDHLVFSVNDGTETHTSRDTALDDNAVSIDSDGTEFGPIIQFDYLIGEKHGFAYGVLFNASYITMSKDGAVSTFSDHQQWDTYSRQITDVYDLKGVIPPAAPYSGDYTGPGPLLPDTPSSRTVTKDHVSSGTQDSWNEINESLDFDLTTLSFGISGEKLFGRFALTAALGPTLSVVDIDAKSTERLYTSRNGGPAQELASWHDRNNDQDLEPGCFVQAGCSLRVAKRLSVNLLGRYDWAKKVSTSVGPTGIDIDLDGFSAMATVSWDM